LNHISVRLLLEPRVAPTRFALAILFSSLAVAGAHAQVAGSSFGIAAAVPPARAVTTSEAMLSLPDSSGSLSSVAVSSSSVSAEDSLAVASPVERFDSDTRGAAFQNFPPNDSNMATRKDKYIKPGQMTPRLTVGDKVKIGIKDAVSPLSAVGWITAAGYSHLVNGQPNYGTNGTAFAQRFGAAAARAGSEGIFSDSIMSSVFHQDPRYYKLGSQQNFFKRVGYSITRPLITRTDGGHQTVNISYLGGNLAGSFLTQAYYPPVNRGVSQVMQTFGGSVGGGALGFFVSEFLDDALQAVHLQHKK
jgi:hypothetical protein